mgnify:CR=1 FL=1
MRKNSFIQGALILTVAGIIVKFIGAFSRIYLSRLLGGEGIGLYQMAYPIYMLCLSIGRTSRGHFHHGGGKKRGE